MMELDWSKRRYEEWTDYLRQAPRANYLQSLPYARAVQDCDRKAVRVGLIRCSGAPCGLLSVHEFKWGPVEQRNLFRGPLWFTGEASEERLIEFAQLYSELFPRSVLKGRKWIPEERNSTDLKKRLVELGLRDARQSYETSWIDLKRPLDDLRRSLQSNWRNALKKAERSEIRLSLDTSGATAKLFLHRYEMDRKEKGYPGRSKAFLREEISTALAYKEVFFLWASDEQKSLAAIMVLVHGQSATYRIGWTTPAGRQVNAHNLLLWRAICQLKEIGLSYFDLGGVEPETAQGVTDFKAGLGGESFSTLGLLS